MLIEDNPVGIVSIKENLIENLYILPNEQHKGYGTKLLQYAIQHCNGVPVLWILENNQKAYALYYKYGFRKSGIRNQITENLSEIEMIQTN